MTDGNMITTTYESIDPVPTEVQQMVASFNSMIRAYLDLPEMSRRLNDLEASAEAGRAEIVSLTSKIADLEKNVTWLREERSRLIAENYDLACERDGHKGKVRELEDVNASLELAIEEFQAKARESAECIDHALRDLNDASERCVQLENQLTETHVLLDTALTELAKVREESVENYRDLLRARRESEDWHELANRHEAKIEAIRQALEKAHHVAHEWAPTPSADQSSPQANLTF